MSRLQLALNVDDLQESIAFYTRLLGTEPAKVKPGYANFAVADPALKLVLIENPGRGGSLNHLGVEVVDTDTVDTEQTRLAAVGLASVDERDSTCCYAKQDKFWVEGAPDGERWEVYTVLEDSQEFGDHAGENEMTEQAQRALGLWFRLLRLVRRPGNSARREDAERALDARRVVQRSARARRLAACQRVPGRRASGGRSPRAGGAGHRSSRTARSRPARRRRRASAGPTG